MIPGTKITGCAWHAPSVPRPMPASQGPKIGRCAAGGDGDDGVGERDSVGVFGQHSVAAGESGRVFPVRQLGRVAVEEHEHQRQPMAVEGRQQRLPVDVVGGVAHAVATQVDAGAVRRGHDVMLGVRCRR